MSIDSSPRQQVIGSLIEHASLRARVTEVLREAMVAGELEPGWTYSAPALDERLGVSATPVHEAALRECGDVLLALAEDALSVDDLVGWLPSSEARRRTDRPDVFKGSGVSWEDLAVAVGVAPTG